MPLEPLLTSAQVAAAEGVTVQFFHHAWRAWRTKFGFPSPVRRGHWCPEALREWRKKRSELPEQGAATGHHSLEEQLALRAINLPLDNGRNCPTARTAQRT